MNTSEVARLREQIELECRAIQHLMQASAVASHRVISRKYQNLDRCHLQLKELVSEEEALSIMIDTYNQVVK